MASILKNLKAPRESAYKACSKLNRSMPRPLAALLAVGNGGTVKDCVSLKTYDGSHQAVHPSVCAFRGALYMACTPYPYGNEWYENPCVYRMENGQWQALPNFPQITPDRMGVEHYSDPVLFTDGETLTLLFRKCERRSSGKVDLLLTSVSTDGNVFFPPIVYAEGLGDHLISPAVTGNSLFAVEYLDGEKALLAEYPYATPFPAQQRQVCLMEGLEPGWAVWHMDIRQTEIGNLEGLFMLRRTDTAEMVSKLAVFDRAAEARSWRFRQDIPLLAEESASLRFVYKSAWQPGNRILCSGCDRRGRYVLFEKTIANMNSTGRCHR